MTLNLRLTVSACSLIVASIMGICSVNAADLTPSNSAISSLKEEALNLSTRRGNRNCFTCVGPRGDRGCPGPKGNPGIAGLTDLAAFENSVANGATATFPANNPIFFGAQTVLVGSAIQSSSPFTSFSLEPGDYQIDVGVSNRVNTTANLELQLQVFLNNMSVPLFVWPASAVAPSVPGTNTPDFIEFSTIISANASSNFLEIMPTKTITLTGTGTSGVVAFINIIKLDRADNQIEENCGS